MPNEASFPIVRSISETASSRRAESKRAESDGIGSRPETFGALVSDAAQARNAARKNTPPVETPQEPVDPRPAPERRPEPAQRAERATPRRSEEGDAHYNSENAPPSSSKTAAADEKPACKDGCKEEKISGDGIAAETGSEKVASETAGAETKAAEPVVPVGTVVASVAAETSGDATVGGVPLAVGGVDKTGGTMLPEAEMPVRAGEAVTEKTAGPMAVAGEVVKAATKTGTATATSEADGDTLTTEPSAKTDDAVISDLTIRTNTAKRKDAGGADAETGAQKVKGDGKGAEGESGAEKTGESGSKAAVPDLAPKRLNRVADMLETFGLSNAIHRPADILAGLDRAVQASAMHGAASRATEISRPTPLQMLPIEIGMQAVRGVTNFQIRLDPAELGRVDVKLQIRDNGEVNASLVVDRVETLAMLKRDASTLQQAFEQAGLKQSPDGLSFSLRGEGQNNEGRRDGNHRAAGETVDENSLQPHVAEVAMRRAYIPNSNLDLMI